MRTTKSPEQFYLLIRGNGLDSLICLDFAFRIPIDGARGEDNTESTKQLQPLVPSLSLVGSTWYTQSSTLHDQHQLLGQCDVKYWLGVDVYRLGQNVMHIERPVKLAFPSTSMGLELAPSSVEQTRFLARAPLYKRCSLKSQSQLTIDLFNSTTSIIPTGTDSARKMVLIPVTVNLRVPPGQKIPQNTLRCVVKMQWQTKTIFSTVPVQTRHLARKAKTQIMQRHVDPPSKLDIQFPPFYQASGLEGPLSRTYRTTSLLEVPVPTAVTLGSINTCLLTREYILDAKFDFYEPNGFKKFMAEGRIPVTIRPTNGHVHENDFSIGPTLNTFANESKETSNANSLQQPVNIELLT